jgi:DNA-directed RNA polymerase subunit M/transcription elongation factor TFIIS
MRAGEDKGHDGRKKKEEEERRRKKEKEEKEGERRGTYRPFQTRSPEEVPRT